MWKASFVSQVWLLQWTKLQCSIDLTEPLFNDVYPKMAPNDFCTAK